MPTQQTGRVTRTNSKWKSIEDQICYQISKSEGTLNLKTRTGDLEHSGTPPELKKIIRMRPRKNK